MYVSRGSKPGRFSAGLGAFLALLTPCVSAQAPEGESDYRTYQLPVQGAPVQDASVQGEQIARDRIPATVAWEDQEWGASQVEHLFNRAAFGARSGKIKRWAKRSPEALVEHLLEGGEPIDPFLVERPRVDRGEMAELSKLERRRLVSKLKADDKRQFKEYVSWWLESMVRGKEPLRDKMTLFWSGLFTSSISKVKRSALMIEQNQILREGALDNYALLLRQLLRDPALLKYLDNDSNRVGQPNENLAREVMELFSLGEGNYSEGDVRAAARALTGRGADRLGYKFTRLDHDHGTKMLLGRRGRFGGDGLVDVLLSQEACARYIAGRIITWFEGVEPTAERLDDYASFLDQEDYAISPFLRRLFLDPAFYRAEIVGARVLGPVEYMVSSCQRLGLDPPPGFLSAACSQLGQSLMDPPNVKGWEEGAAWISTSTLMDRGNIMGVLLGALSSDDFLDTASPEVILAELDESLASELDAAVSMDDGPEDVMADEVMSGEAMTDEAMSSEVMSGEMMSGDAMSDETMSDEMMSDEMMSDEMMSGDAGVRTVEPSARPDRSANGGTFKLVRYMERLGYRPPLNLSARMKRNGLSRDGEIVDTLAAELLAIPLPEETRLLLLDFLEQRRAALGLRSGDFADYPYEAEQILRHLAHLILSLPEAQLG